jgi:hypothetical protein
VPLSALFLLMMGVGGWLVYDAVKGKHPWQDFTSTVKGSQPGSAVPPLGSGATDVTEPPVNVGGGHYAQ